MLNSKNTDFSVSFYRPFRFRANQLLSPRRVSSYIDLFAYERLLIEIERLEIQSTRSSGFADW